MAAGESREVRGGGGLGCWIESKIQERTTREILCQLLIHPDKQTRSSVVPPDQRPHPLDGPEDGAKRDHGWRVGVPSCIGIGQMEILGSIDSITTDNPTIMVNHGPDSLNTRIPVGCGAKGAYASGSFPLGFSISQRKSRVRLLFSAGIAGPPAGYNRHVPAGVCSGPLNVLLLE